jgi:6-pyruvoyl tetrahydropterin synthase/QueD family protein
LRHHENIELVVLESADSVGGAVVRSHTRTDTERLFACLDSCLRPMPGVQARFHENTPQVTVVKEVVFDSAHFITDHPAKCSNLHGGRYKLQVKVAGRIDPCTGCVIDYGYLKRVVNRRVVEAFDHHTLNYVAAELAWRSSTEMLCVYIWERLIEYLPGMVELQLYETEQSWCHYRGPDLGVFQQQGGSVLLHHFTGMDAGDDELRQQLVTVTDKALSVVA